MIKTLKMALLAGALVLVAGRAAAQEPTPRDSAQPAAGPAVSEDHKAEAVKHTTAAVDAGKSGSASGVAGHAEQALTHAQALAKQQPSEEVNAAVKSLEDAVTKGKAGDADAATKSAEDALEKLQPKQPK